MHEQFLKTLRQTQECEPIEALRAFTNRILGSWGAAQPGDCPPAVAAVADELVGIYDAGIQEAPPFTDLLGPIYTEIASPAQIEGAGQFFTPPDVADLMVASQLTGRPRPRAGHQLVHVGDQAVGSGGLLLAFARAVLARWPEDLAVLHLEGIDVVHLAAEIAAIQLVANCTLHGCRLGRVVVWCGDTIAGGSYQLVVDAQDPARASAAAG